MPARRKQWKRRVPAWLAAGAALCWPLWLWSAYHRVFQAAIPAFGPVEPYQAAYQRTLWLHIWIGLGLIGLTACSGWYWLRSRRPPRPGPGTFGANASSVKRIVAARGE